MGVKENPIRLISNEKIALILISFSKKIKGSAITVIRKKVGHFRRSKHTVLKGCSIGNCIIVW